MISDHKIKTVVESVAYSVLKDALEVFDSGRFDQANYSIEEINSYIHNEILTDSSIKVLKRNVNRFNQITLYEKIKVETKNTQKIFERIISK